MLESRGHTSPHTPYVTAYTLSACALCECSVCTQKVPRREYLNTFSNFTLLFGCWHIPHIRKSAYTRDSQFQSRPVTRPRPLVYAAMMLFRYLSVSFYLNLLLLVLVLLSRLFFSFLSLGLGLGRREVAKSQRGFTKNCIPE
jgi:hypothetical protein